MAASRLRLIRVRFPTLDVNKKQITLKFEFVEKIDEFEETEPDRRTGSDC